MKFLSRLFIFGGLFLLLLSIVAWKFPASWMLDRVDWSGHGISYDDIDGTLWLGKAEGVEREGLLLGDINWDFQTLNQLSPFSTTWRVYGEGPDHKLHSFVDIVGQNASDLRFVHGYFPAGWVDLSRAVPLLFLTGTFNLDLDHASPALDAANLASGTIRWTDAGLSGLVEESLGTIVVELHSDGRFTIADIQSEENPAIMISGQVRVNNAQYRADVKLKTTEEKQYVVDKLAHLGTLLDDGTLEFSLSGGMPR
jgi:hypothetical protein